MKTKKLSLIISLILLAGSASAFSFALNVQDEEGNPAVIDSICLEMENYDDCSQSSSSQHEFSGLETGFYTITTESSNYEDKETSLWISEDANAGETTTLQVESTGGDETDEDTGSDETDEDTGSDSTQEESGETFEFGFELKDENGNPAVAKNMCLEGLESDYYQCQGYSSDQYTFPNLEETGMYEVSSIGGGYENKQKSLWISEDANAGETTTLTLQEEPGDDDGDDDSGDTDNGGQGGNGDDNGDDDNGDDPEANFDVTVNAPSDGDGFESGSNVEVEYTVENTGDESDEQDIEFSVDNNIESSERIELEEGSSHDGVFTWDTSGLDEDSYSLEVSSDDSSDSVSVDLVEDLDEADFQVSIDSPSDGDQFDSGDEVDIDYTVENTGDESDTQEIRFTVEGSDESSQELTLDGGVSESRTFTWTTSGQDDGDYSLEVLSEDSSDSITVTLGEESEDDDEGTGSGGGTQTATPVVDTTPDVSLELSHETIVAGGSVQASGFVENAREGQTVSIELDGNEVATTETSSDGYYEANFVPEEIGTKTVTARSDGGEASAELEVTPSIEITSLTHPETVEVDESFQICAEADSQVEPEFRLFEDGASVASDSGSGEICFDRTLSEAGTYGYEMVASAGSNQDNRTFSIEATQTGAGTGEEPQQGLTGAFLESMSGTWARLLISIIVGAIITVLALSIEI